MQRPLMLERLLIAALLLGIAPAAAQAQPRPPQPPAESVEAPPHARIRSEAIPQGAVWQEPPEQHDTYCECAACCDLNLWQRWCGGWGGKLREAVTLRSSRTHGRYTGHGDPLIGTSWMNRPFGIGGFVGPIIGDELIADGVAQDTELFYGFRVGADLDHYWGTELRLGWSSPKITDEQNPPNSRRADTFYFDASALYYPWGDSRWRPYALAGFGIAAFTFEDHQGHFRDKTLLGMPIGGGIKYQYHPNIAVRTEVLDNLAFGNDLLNTMHNVSFAISVEYRFGGPRKSYYPWHPSRIIE